jgi:hypothetical protein
MYDGKRYIESMLNKMDLFDDLQEEPEYIKMNSELGDLDLEINRLKRRKTNILRQKKVLQSTLDTLEAIE